MTLVMETLWILKSASNREKICAKWTVLQRTLQIFPLKVDSEMTKEDQEEGSADEN